MIRLINKQNILILSLWVINIFMVIATLLMKDKAHGYLYKIALLIVVVLFLLSYKIHYNQTGMLVSIIFISFYSLFINILLIENIVFDDIIRILYFISTLWFFYTCVNIKVNKFIYYAIYLIILIISAIYIFSFYVNPQYLGDRLILGYGNPNYLGMWLSIVIMYLLFFLDNNNPIIMNIITIVLCIYIGYLLLLTNSRTSIVTVVIYLSYLLFHFKNRRVNTYVLMLLILFPFIFALSYCLLSIIIGDSELIVLGKNIFTGREKIWINYWYLLSSNPFTGLYRLLNDNYINIHNTLLSILYYYGILVFIPLIYFLIRMCSFINKRMELNKIDYLINKKALLLFVCILLLGVGESTLFMMGTGMYIFAGTAILFTNYSNSA